MIKILPAASLTLGKAQEPIFVILFFNKVSEAAAQVAGLTTSPRPKIYNVF
jgi:hypothetical protein